MNQETLSKEQIQELLICFEENKQEEKDLRRRLNDVCKQNNEIEKTIKKYCEKIIRQRFQPFTLYFYGIHFYDNKINLTGSIKTDIFGRYLYYVDGNFLWSDQQDLDKIYPHHILTDLPKFDSTILLNKCDELYDELGIKVEFKPIKLIKKFDQKYPTNIDDIKLIHPNAIFLYESKIRYLGWDCEDEWVLLEDLDGLHLYYGDTAHGGEFNKHIRPGESFEVFLNPPSDTTIQGIHFLKSLIMIRKL